MPSITLLTLTFTVSPSDSKMFSRPSGKPLKESSIPICSIPTDAQGIMHSVGARLRVGKDEGAGVGLGVGAVVGRGVGMDVGPTVGLGVVLEEGALVHVQGMSNLYTA